MKENRSSFWTFFIHKRAVSWLFLIGIIFLGSFSAINLPMELQPDITIPMGTVSTFLPGGNPSDIEDLITKPLEKDISTLSNIKNLTSSSSIGTSLIVVEFEANANLDKSIRELKDIVDRSKGNLPEDATEPMVIQLESNTIPIISFSIIGKRSLYELTQITEDIQAELEKISGVSKVSISGKQKKIIEVKIDPDKAKSYGLNIQNISDIIKYSDPNIPVGIIRSDNLNYSIRIDNKYQDLDGMRNIPLLVLPDENATEILLSDISTVKETFLESNTVSKLSINNRKSLDAITLQVYKKEGANALTIADDSKEKIKELNKTLIPHDVDITISNDYSVFIRTDLGILTNNGIQTTIFIIVILFLALGLIEGLIAGLIIPLSLLFAFIIMDLEEMTINSLTLFSLVIALGLMVDTAIIIMEGIHDNMKKGLSSKEAAIESVQTFKWPLIAGTLTTIFAFIPMLLVSGILGEFLKALPLTISAALFGSLFISLTISPSITAKLLSKRKIKDKQTILEPVFDFFSKIYQKIIDKIIHKKSVRTIIILSSIALFTGSMALPISGTLKMEMFPKTDIHLFLINIETPRGTVIEETIKVTEKVENILYEIPEIENFLTIIGSNQGIVATDIIEVSGSTESHLANITVNLVPKDERERKSYELASEVRTKLQNFKDGKVVIQELSEGPPTEAPITVRISGENAETLQEIADHIETVIREIPGTINIDTGLQPGLDEFKYTLDGDKIAHHGLAISEVAMLIRNSVQGINPSSLTIADEELDIYVKYDFPEIDEKTNLSINDLENIEIPTTKGYSVSLSELGDYEFTKSLAAIGREDQKRIVKVRSELKADINPVEITKIIQEKLEDYEIPKGYDISFRGDLSDIDKSFNDLYRSMVVGIILIAFTLVLMFNSLKQPLIILFTLPMALIGVFPGLFITGINLSFPAFLGVVALTGIAVNDAIVLIDRINKNRESGLRFKESIKEAAKSRLQPIIMTSITTIVGILPLALTNEFWKGLGFALIFGLTFSTILTLIVVPALYYLFEGRKALKKERIVL